MNGRLRLLAICGAAHLMLVAASAAHIELISPRCAAGRLIAAYGALSGSDNTFGFFAPHVAPQFRLRLTLSDAQGQTWEEPANRGLTREARLRFASMTSLLAFENLQPRVAASFAAALFGRCPTATRVEVVAEAQDMPTMEAFRDGYRARWETIYEGEFSRREENTAQRSEKNTQRSEPDKPN